MAVLNIKWQAAESMPATVGTVTPSEGEEANEAESGAARLEKPLLVWVFDPSEEIDNKKVESVIFDPDKIRIGSNYFNCIKMPVEKADADALLGGHGKKTPRAILVTVDREVATVIDGKVSVSKLYGAMKKVAGKTYKGNFDKNVKAVIKLLNELDKIADERKMLAKKEQRDLSPAKAKKIAKEIEDLDEREEEALEKRKELMAPERKTA